MASLPGHWAAMTLPQRVEFSRTVLTGPRGGIVLAPSVEEAYRFINDYAPEHLELLSTEPFAHLGHITNAAEVLMGPHTPIVIANFVLGPNGVLPTGGWARTYGPLSVTDYMKRSSVGYVTSAAYPGPGAALEAPVGIRGLLVACQCGVGDQGQAAGVGLAGLGNARAQVAPRHPSPRRKPGSIANVRSLRPVPGWTGSDGFRLSPE